MSMKNFNCDKFLNTFQSYFDLKIEKGRTTYCYGKKDITIYYQDQNYIVVDDAMIMVVDIKYENNIDNLSVSVRIPFNNRLGKKNGMLINSMFIKKYLDKAKLYMPVFKKIMNASCTGKPYMHMIFALNQIKDERGILRHKISNVTYRFEVSYNISDKAMSGVKEDYIQYVDTYLEKYFLNSNIDVQGSSYQHKLDLFNMMEI